MRVLLVDDDGVLRDVLGRRLRAEGFVVDEADTIEGTKKSLTTHVYDCVVLDRWLADGDAIDLVAPSQEHLATTHGPALNGAAVLFLTARKESADRLAGFAAGADDYLGKPFDLTELVARLRSLCRGDRRPVPSRTRWGDLMVDRATGSVERGDVLLALRPKEFAVLEVLIEAGGGIVSSEDLFERCWDAGTDLFSNTIYAHMASLQRKLGTPPVIRSVRGVGYALAPPAPA